MPGSLVLGQVSYINRYDIALSLPDNLTGYVPLTSISDGITQKVEALVAEDEDKEEAEAADDRTDSKEINLQSYFSVGQYLRAYVTSTQEGTESKRKGRKHIELSINPRAANTSLSKSEVVVNSMVQASVVSVEDHGLIMNLGIEDTTMRGFMSTRELGQIDVTKIEEGTVFLCLVTGTSSNGKIIKLSADSQRAGNIKKSHFLTDALTVDAFLPGTAVEVLLSDVNPLGIAGKVMGLLNATADLIHSGGAASGKELDKKYSTGSKIKGRIICTFPSTEEKKVCISVLDHVISLKSLTVTPKFSTTAGPPTDMLPLSTILEQVRVVKVEPGMGLFVDVGVKGLRGFVHISRVADAKVESLPESTGPYKLGSVHKARIIGYNPMDGLFIVSLERKIIDEPFLRFEDVNVGQVVKGTIEKIMVNETGVSGMLVGIAEGISGLVLPIHMADVLLQHPERKFKEGSTVTARVLSTDPEKRQLRLTLKKSLVNTDAEVWDSYEKLKPGMQAPGTLISILPSGAVVQFYSSVRGFLPVSEMSESYIQDPKQHFRIGQVVKVHVVSINPTEERMMISCKDPAIFGSSQREALKELEIGSVVGGTVSEKLGGEIIVELSGGIKALLPFEHLSDGSSQKCITLAKKIRVNQVLNDLLVLNKSDSKPLVKLTSKPSLVKASKDGRLLKTFEDVQEGEEVAGYIQSITPTGIFVRFAAELTGLLLKTHLPEESKQLPDFGMRQNESISPKVLSADHEQRRFLLTLKPVTESDLRSNSSSKCASVPKPTLSNPVDGVSTTLDDYIVGKLTKARITSIKATQLNVLLADNVPGRVDVSETFDGWDEIKHTKRPLKAFHVKQILPVRVLGFHDSRNHRFLPVSHRKTTQVFELTAKTSLQTQAELDMLTLEKVEVGSIWPVFVNNISDDCVWVNLSPIVRGRIRTMDVSSDVSLLKDLSKNFPVGSALKAKVISIDTSHNRLELSARSDGSALPPTLNDVSKGMILPGRVTKVTERQVMVQLNNTLSGVVGLTDLADDYSKANPSAYQKNQIVRVCVRDVDLPNKRVALSMRPSKVLSSSLPVEDPEFTLISELNVNDIIKGFVKNVTDAGLFVNIGTNITAFVKVSDLSDLFLKDWKSHFEIDRLVKGRITVADAQANRLQMSLKQSHVDKDYQPPLTFADMTIGKVVTGKVRKVADFGVFVVVDGSANISGLCHRSELADHRAPDPAKLYNEGDAVQAKVLKIDQAKKQLSFGLKASYFDSNLGSRVPLDADSSDGEDLENDSDDESDGATEGMNGVKLEGSGEENEDAETDAEMEDADSQCSDDGGENPNLDDGGVSIVAARNKSIKPAVAGLATNGFDWTGGMAGRSAEDMDSESDGEPTEPKRKRRRKAEIKIDKTGDLDANGPQSIADFERLLMGQPNSSVLWLSYMAFQLQLSEVSKAREIAERAIKTINIREETEKMNVWIALLNLENTYGTEESLEEVFKRACQYNDGLEMHERLISIHIQSGNHEVNPSYLSKHID